MLNQIENTAALAAIWAEARKALLPPPRIPLSEWAEANICLPDTAAQSGPLRLWPFQRQMADSIGDPTVERVTIVKPVRAGFTMLLASSVASYIANDPAPILLVQPTQDDCRDFVVSDLEPLIDASPVVRGMMTDDSDGPDRDTLLSRRWPGGSLKVVAARSPRSLRRHTVRVLLLDEVDGYEATQEGDPIKLAERRTLSFSPRKIVMGSTPVWETGPVLTSYVNSDQRVYEVPCPDCGHFHEIKWADIQWPEGQPEKAAYVCPACGSVVDEAHKAQMVAKGRWRATAPHVQDHHGYRFNALVSLLANCAWGTLAREFVQAKGRPDLLQTFVNTILAEPWRDSEFDVDESTLQQRAEPFALDSMPADVLTMTVGVDVQGYGLDMLFVGFDAGRHTAYVLGQMVIYGDPNTSDPWGELSDVLGRRWKHPAGGTIGVDACAIDSSDGNTMQAVYSFCKGKAFRRIVPIKGMAGRRLPIEQSKSGGGRLFIVGVDGLKQQIATRLAKGTSIRFSDTLGARFYEEIVSERLETKYQRGRPIRQWVRIMGRRSESLDCMVYALAARQLVQVDDTTRRAELSSIQPPKPAPIQAKSKWLSK
ncbi:terminase [Novacetimonas maltaceti]|uniref:Phage terminase large subunit n=1 Tax=Novacetimonas maltaceti TaxID=1203393 RepID=A0A2S3W3X0_9PROT|nr:phage terminase large subunit family protein [Novacetimonas maltaceti]POF63561.1 Phage terminase large subunit [Novacetimonas maltaceti]PYD59834.1 terminase [Novacetimonas maltaceti]